MNIFKVIEPITAVPDPITKRNRVRTPEERKSSILKRKEEERKSKGILKLKEKETIQNRIIAKKNRAMKPKRGEFKVDVWKEEQVIEPELKSEWLTNDTVRHTLTNTGKKRKRIPKSVQKKPSVLPALTVPHPGTSYNPLPADHQNLLAQVAAEELKIIKEEKHLERVTNKMFRKVTSKQRDEDNLKEMSEGLPLQDEKTISDEEDSDPNIKSINPPVKRDKKTLQQRRKRKEQRMLEHQIKKQKLEKRKVADIYHLNQIRVQMSIKQKKEAMLKEKRLKFKAKKALEPKVLSRHKFEPLEQEFLLRSELSGNLRNAQPAGNLLKDRYKSFQQRNIVAPGIIEMKKLKAKVKRYIKPDHKIDMKKVLK
ncbi:ribosome biogenesis protein NOP53 isoform X2 [Phymastichus coffea]|uniref:ribosome biogenesis protein NOP53 isoform X2 n=1 Tax=Phymastichus coffea TaxID=108790 RepID=UPI00273C1F8B|nr:ribosome biogenesis protein NOP53 isoform X2 [Phymastichus coffea]